MTPRQRRYMGALCVSTALAMCAALTAGWVALAFGVGSAVILVAVLVAWDLTSFRGGMK